MGENVVKNKSFDFAVKVVRLFQFLSIEKREFVLSKQVLRSGTNVGAMMREDEHAETKKDFIHKMAIAQKEINETIYWLELLKETDYITEEQFKNINDSAIELIKLITAILRKAKSNLNKNNH